jgi:hypothetical protein
LREGLHYRLTMQVYYVNAADKGFSHAPDPVAYRHTEPAVPDRSAEAAGAASLMRPKNVLMNFFRTRRGDPRTTERTKVSENMSRFAGRTVRLRLVEVDNQGNFSAAVDAVKLKHR